MVKRYEERDIMELDEVGNHYSNHVCAMTGESLHGKSDIAAELGYRDMVIDQLQKDLHHSRMAAEAEAQYANELKAHCEELKEGLRRSMVTSDADFDFSTHNEFQELLNKSPSTCLAEVEARAVENCITACVVNDNLWGETCDPDDLRYYAQQLREKAK